MNKRQHRWEGSSQLFVVFVAIPSLRFQVEFQCSSRDMRRADAPQVSPGDRQYSNGKETAARNATTHEKQEAVDLKAKFPSAELAIFFHQSFLAVFVSFRAYCGLAVLTLSQ